MNLCIITNGSMPDYDKASGFIEESDKIICADGGAVWAMSNNIVPDYLIGDFDSIPKSVLEYYKKKEIYIKQYPKIKDDTDTAIAANMAIDMGAEKVFILGGLGSRVDHSIGNIMLLQYLYERNIFGVLIDQKNEVFISNKKTEIKGAAGQLLSILPYGGEVFIRSTKGLYYPIMNKSLSTDKPLGVSNVFTESSASVDIESGWALFIKPVD